MIVQDTNLFSELMKDTADKHVLAWYEQFTDDDFAITAISVGELLFGLARMPQGKRKDATALLIDKQLTPLSSRILPFDNIAATYYAQIKAYRQKIGQPISEQDAMIAAIARSYGATVATRSIKDFEGTGVDLINPWEYEKAAS